MHLVSALNSANLMLLDMKLLSTSRTFKPSSDIRNFISFSCHVHKPIWY